MIDVCRAVASQNIQPCIGRLPALQTESFSDEDLESVIYLNQFFPINEFFPKLKKEYQLMRSTVIFQNLICGERFVTHSPNDRKAYKLMRNPEHIPSGLEEGKCSKLIKVA